jgi:cytochrome c
MKGSSGVWGPVPMPANAQVKEAEAKTLAAWVLSSK